MTEDTAHPSIRGVFSTMETRKVGTGTTLRKTKVKQYWLVNQLDQELAEVQPINDKLIPVGKKRSIAVSTLLERFAPEPDFYLSPTGFPPEPSESQLDMEEAAPEEPAEPPHTEPPHPEPLPAEPLPGLKVEIEGFELTGSAEDIEKSARAGFGLGITYLRRGNQEKAEDIFSRLAEMDAAFVPEHKHMFNDFGVSLRKQSLFDMALKHYLRALELAGEDDHLLHNIARAYFEKKDIKNCVRYLEKSLEVNPGLTVSQQFLRYLERQENGPRKGPGSGRRRKKGKAASGPIRLDF